MKADPSRWSLVIVGRWNQAIFNPEWVQQHVFVGSESIEGEIGLGDQGLVYQFTAGDVRLRVLSDKVQFNPTTVTADNLSRLERAGTNLLRRLSDTPVTAFGINFGFDVDRGVAGSLAKLLDHVDTEQLVRLGASVQSTMLRRRLLFEEEIINLTLAREGSLPIRIDLNHHHQVSGAPACREMIEGSMVPAKELTERLLRDLYGLASEAA